jgi:hypothetical protein
MGGAGSAFVETHPTREQYTACLHCTTVRQDNGTEVSMISPDTEVIKECPQYLKNIAEAAEKKKDKKKKTKDKLENVATEKTTSRTEGVMLSPSKRPRNEWMLGDACERVLAAPIDVMAAAVECAKGDMAWIGDNTVCSRAPGGAVAAPHACPFTRAFQLSKLELMLAVRLVAAMVQQTKEEESAELGAEAGEADEEKEDPDYDKTTMRERDGYVCWSTVAHGAARAGNEVWLSRAEALNALLTMLTRALGRQAKAQRDKKISLINNYDKSLIQVPVSPRHTVDWFTANRLSVQRRAEEALGGMSWMVPHTEWDDLAKDVMEDPEAAIGVALTERGFGIAPLAGMWEHFDQLDAKIRKATGKLHMPEGKVPTGKDVVPATPTRATYKERQRTMPPGAVKSRADILKLKPADRTLMDCRRAGLCMKCKTDGHLIKDCSGQAVGTQPTGGPRS